MPLFGTLSTMSLADLLQWLGSAIKTGTLQVERNRATKVVRVRDGRVIGCSSDHPSQRLGQFLLSRKKITEEHLRQALTIMEETSQMLGQTLVEMGALTADELVAELKAKAEEIIYSLFDWSDGVFRFEETVDDEGVFAVDLRIDDVLLRGLKRFDEMSQITSVLHDPGIVLRYTSKPPGAEIFADETSRAMYSAIDGERTLADIVLHVHGTEYRVKRFLFELHERGYVEIMCVKTPEATEAAPEDPPLDLEPELYPMPLDARAASSRPDVTEPAAPPALEPRAPEPPSPTTARKMSAIASAPAVAAAPPASREAKPEEPADLARASRLMADGDLEGALDVLDALYKENPGDDALRRLTAEAEAAFVDKAYRHYLPCRQVPILTRPIESLQSESLTPQEFFILSRIDGSWDIKSIIQVAPFREVEALRTLKRMRDLGMIELCEPS